MPPAIPWPSDIPRLDISKICRGRVKLDMLPDDVLLEVFDYFLFESYEDKWMRLVGVCRKWRNVVFGSPHRLNLRLLCTDTTCVKEMFSIWPPLPIIIEGWPLKFSENPSMDNIVEALGKSDRVREFKLGRVKGWQMEQLLAAMREPFPELTRMHLLSERETTPVLPDSFLGGYAPRLQYLSLSCISSPTPVLRKLFLSTTHLVHLLLWDVPQSGYIPPEEMITCLSALTSLETFYLLFESPPPLRVQASRRPSPPARTLLPALTELQFTGISEYLEDLVARIDVPLLTFMKIIFFHQLIFHTPRLAHFISRTPQLKAPTAARVSFCQSGARATIISTPVWFLPLVGLMVKTSCNHTDWQLSSIAQFCSSSLPLVSSFERLYIFEDMLSQLHWQDDIENDQWLELLHPFISVKDFYMTKEFALRIAPTLRELAGVTAIEVLPALQNLFLAEPNPPGPIMEAIDQFVAARQLSGHPVVVSSWDREDSQWWSNDDF